MTGVKAEMAIQALFVLPCTGAGVAATCRSILDSCAAAHYQVELFTSAFDRPGDMRFTVRHQLPTRFHRVPYAMIKGSIRPRLVSHYLRSVQPGQVAYLWPKTPVSVFQTLADRGVAIVVESLNTRMQAAKPILDAAYDSVGLKPGHGITSATIAEQNERHGLATAIFSPSPATDAAFAGTPYADRVIPVSYGTWVPETREPRPPRSASAPVTFLFLGTACIRKGAHLLLEAWKGAPSNARLRIVGRIEPAVARLYRDVLDLENVSCAGFSRNVAAELEGADVAILPSLEEGDPISTYESAAHGLPVIASPAGAGRIGAETGAFTMIDPYDIDAMRDTISAFVASDDMRRERGLAVRAAVLGYDWSIAGPRRFDLLAEALRSGRLSRR